MTDIYVFSVYVQCLQTFFQQNKFNVSLREPVRLIARNPFCQILSPSSSTKEKLRQKKYVHFRLHEILK